MQLQETNSERRARHLSLSERVGVLKHVARSMAEEEFLTMDCKDTDCEAQACPEHPAHNGSDHTYEQHHAPEDHVGPGPCRCPVYRP